MHSYDVVIVNRYATSLAYFHKNGAKVSSANIHMRIRERIKRTLPVLPFTVKAVVIINIELQASDEVYFYSTNYRRNLM